MANVKKSEFVGRTLAYRSFKNTIWKTEKLLELGVVGIDQAMKGNEVILTKLKAVKKPRGRVPKSHQASATDLVLPDGRIATTFDPVTSATMAWAVGHYNKKHSELKYFLNSNIFASVWASFETYNQMLFEELLTKKPEMLKSKELISIENVVNNRINIVEFLVERQVETIGHFNVKELFEYLKIKVNYVPNSRLLNVLNDYYFIRNLIAHKSGIVRKSQLAKLPSGVRCLKGELQISSVYLQSMVKKIDLVVTAIEKMTVEKFFESNKKSTQVAAISKSSPK
jgi:hypothetical protein